MRALSSVPRRSYRLVRWLPPKLALGALLGVGLATGGIVLCRDEPPPDLSDLRVAAPNVSRSTQLASLSPGDSPASAAWRSALMDHVDWASSASVDMFPGGCGLSFVSVWEGLSGKQLSVLVRDPTVSLAELHAGLRFLEQARPSRAEQVRDVFCGFYLQRLDGEIAAATASPPHLDELLTYDLPDSYLPLLRPAFKPHQTQRWLAEELRAYLAAVDRPVTALPVVPRPPNDWRWFGPVPRPDNALGRAILANIEVEGAAILQTSAGFHTQYSATLTLLALQLHERAHGHLPSTLADLVPAYLSAVPRNYYTAAAVGYDPAGRAVVIEEKWLQIAERRIDVPAAAPL